MALTLAHFEVFLAVAEAKSFTGGAKKLGNSKASVSQAIRLLESSLHLPLFIRSTRRVSLTDEGELLYVQCQRLKYELDIARELVKDFNTSPTGTLRISCNPYFAESRLLKILKQYTELFPKVNIEVLAEERMPNMQKEQIDIVFGINWPAPEDVVARKIGTTRYVLCASPDYIQKFGMPKDIKSLESHDYIPHSGRSHDNVVASLKHKVSLNFSPQLKTNHAYFMKKCALQGFGIVQLHDYMVKDELNHGSLVEILPEQMDEQVSLFVYYNKFRFVQPKIKQFIHLCECL